MGAVVGLVAISPAAGVVPPLAAIPIGLGAGLFGYLAVWLKHRLPVDDPLDAWPIHSVGGIWGAVATGLFATAAVNAAGDNGLLAGNPRQLLNEVVGVVVVALYAGAMTWLILKLLGLFMTLRVAEAEEEAWPRRLTAWGNRLRVLSGSHEAASDRSGGGAAARRLRGTRWAGTDGDEYSPASPSLCPSAPR